MHTWYSNTSEISYIYNPAYCSLHIYKVIQSYNNNSMNKNFPFPLLYVVLPLLLNEEISRTIDGKKRFSKWLEENANILVNYPKKMKCYIKQTNEAFEFLLACNLLKINKKGEIEIVRELDKLKKKKLPKATQFGKILAEAGSPAIIYFQLGVKP